MKTKTLILASASPRRVAILRQLGIDFQQIVSLIVDEQTGVDDPKDHVLLLSRRKAEDVARRTSAKWILGADTIVVSDGWLIGKPEDADSAHRMLRQLSGRVHSVYTGLTLIESQAGRALSRCEETYVRIRPLSDKDIADYIATGEPLGKAGAYAIQGLGGTLVERIEGCYYNVVGLPIVRMIDMMGTMGFPFQLKRTRSRETKPSDIVSIPQGTDRENIQ